MNTAAAFGPKVLLKPVDPVLQGGNEGLHGGEALMSRGLHPGHVANQSFGDGK